MDNNFDFPGESWCPEYPDGTEYDYFRTAEENIHMIRVRYDHVVLEIEYDEETFTIEKKDLSRGYDVDLSFRSHPNSLGIAPYLRIGIDVGPIFRMVYLEHTGYRFDRRESVEFGVYREPLFSICENGVDGPLSPDIFAY